MSQSLLSMCDHSSVCFSSSPHATEAAFKPPGPRERVGAIKGNNPIEQKKDILYLKDDPSSFPAPLLLPEDDLFEDQEAYTQSFQEWKDGEDRNPVTAKRKTVYVVPTPEIDAEVSFMRIWSKPHSSKIRQETQAPGTKDVRDYLAAFYHGLEVKMMQSPVLRFIPWEEGSLRSKSSAGSRVPKYVGLAIGGECVRIRARRSPDGLYDGQLNLDDLLDAAISLLPKDAYSLLLLVDFDLYEDEDDIFVCGRAYGGSRVAVVSSTRYNPSLDEIQHIDRLHSWPASHCEKYMSTFGSASAPPSTKRRKQSQHRTRGAQNSSSPLDPPVGPMKQAISAYRSLPHVPSSLSPLWLGRVCRTASHELGHCFGMAHCVYYACSMQGTASVCEDARQPPYLCPVDLAKVLHATSTTASDRYRALLAFCKRPQNKNTHFFEPFAAWLRSRLSESENF
ncbi:hypothetical protein N7474_001315 [Penicillium riverlandense]|uniref:uncharacterized protein n=1 Tax=Penicillium riverlandense TaxID=1903569 RepID=UPI00254997C0|nr:uncharacterized protein N7474_001315 [Penicillium riverlandense]KAJ5833004.1 hypothetical protein N7474_001315 [Penicillium riverlandense]